MADPVSASVIGAGALMGGTGNLIANLEQADAEERNAQWLDEQARFAEKAGQLDYARRADELNEFRGSQIANFGARGGAFGSTEASLMAETDRRIERELAAIRAQTDINVREAMLRGKDARMKAGRLRSFGLNALQFGGSVLGGAGRILSSQPSDSSATVSTKTPTQPSPRLK